MDTFQGHRVLALIWDVLIPVSVLILVNHFIYYFKSLNRTHSFLLIPAGYVLAIALPNSVYAMLEVKHLLMIDGVADSLNVWSFVVFGGLSVFGFVATIYQNILLINCFARTMVGRLFCNSILSLVGGFGSVAGLLNFTSNLAYNPIFLFKLLKLFLLRSDLVGLSLAISLFVFLSTTLADRMLKPSL